MTCQLNLNWKSIAALGLSATCIILAKKVMPEQAAEVLNNLVNTFKIVIGDCNDD